MFFKNLFRKWNKLSLVKQIIIGLAVGIILAVLFPQLTFISVLGSLFVGALKSVAPVLVLLLVMAAICQHKSGQKTNMKSILLLYIVGTFLASLASVVASFIFKFDLVLGAGAEDISAPGGLSEVIQSLLGKVIANPITALSEANYIAILAWALILGLALRGAKDGTKNFIGDIANAVTQIVKWIIRFAPLGILGLVFTSISETGLSSLLSYARILLLLVGVMAFVALVLNPIIVFIKIRKNPYPLVFKCLKDSGITAFFTRSSAANIPVNMALCKELGLDENTYSISIPLGATINMSGAAVTISVLTLAATHTLGISVDIPSAILLSFIAAISACGSSGVAGGSLMLIPLACSLFGIPNDVAMQVVGVGFVVGVIQDSCETALNSSTDVLFTAAAQLSEQRKKA